MSEEKKEESIFRQDSLQSLYNPVKFDTYIKTSRIFEWVLVVGLLLGLIGFFIWGFVGKIPQYLNAYAYAETDGNLVSLYVGESNISQVKTDMKANGSSVSGKVTNVYTVPVSEDSIKLLIGDEHVFDSLNLSEKWNYKVEVTLEGNVQRNDVISLGLLVKEIMPISYFFN